MIEASKPAERRILLVATMRNEGPFIVEWVAHHRTIGFTDIIVCSNDCVDGSPILLDRLGALGLITHIRTVSEPGGKAQLDAYAQAEALPLLGDADWAMVLDADEFLNVHIGSGTVTDLIDAVPAATAFLINWRMFGNAGHETWEPGLVTERFRQAAARDDAVNLSFKTLFRMIDAYQCKLMPHQPRYPRPERLADLHYVDGAGATLPLYFADESRDSFLQSEPGRVRWDLAQINHYNTRSQEDYLVKHHRGGGLNIAWERETSWAMFNKNNETDVTIAATRPAMQRLAAGWLEDEDLRRCQERCCTLYAAHIAHLKTHTGGDGVTR